MFTSPGAVCFSLFGFDIYWYGIIMGLSVLTGVLFSDFVRKQHYKEISEDVFFSIISVAIISGFFGARLYYCLVNFSYYSNHLLDIFNFRQGGLSIHGGVLSALIFASVYAYQKKLPVITLCDLCSYGLILAQAIGRWGNFFNSEAFGKPTDIFCKLFIPISNRPFEYIDYEYFHPTFLYESILDFIIFIFLYFVLRNKVKKSSGLIFSAYLFLYSCARIVVESLRIDCSCYIYKVPLPIFVSILLIIISVVWMVLSLKNMQKF